MNDVICINDTFSDEWLSWALENNVKHPIKDKVYKLRGVKRHTNGETGIYLDEIRNPQVPQMGGVFNLEPSFNKNRFTTLLGLPFEKIEETEILIYENNSRNN
jgi:hypothetical protein